MVQRPRHAVFEVVGGVWSRSVGNGNSNSQVRYVFDTKRISLVSGTNEVEVCKSGREREGGGKRVCIVLDAMDVNVYKRLKKRELIRRN